jgi:hypothetical protein
MTTSRALFPANAIAAMRETKWNPSARMAYEGFSGGLMWDDEFPDEAIEACVNVDNWAYRSVIAYRASLVRGLPREDLRQWWDQLARECPNWPGFRSERRSPDLLAILEAKEKAFIEGMDALDAEIRNQNSN